MRFLDKKGAAKRITDTRFPVSHRTLEAWPDLRGRVVNGRKYFTPEEVDQAADTRIARAEAAEVEKNAA
jgi:hypothetical protein